LVFRGRVAEVGDLAITTVPVPPICRRRQKLAICLKAQRRSLSLDRRDFSGLTPQHLYSVRTITLTYSVSTVAQMRGSEPSWLCKSLGATTLGKAPTALLGHGYDPARVRTHEFTSSSPRISSGRVNFQRMGSALGQETRGFRSCPQRHLQCYKLLRISL
jgi:hypothetical protein